LKAQLTRLFTERQIIPIDYYEDDAIVNFLACGEYVVWKANPTIEVYRLPSTLFTDEESSRALDAPISPTEASNNLRLEAAGLSYQPHTTKDTAGQHRRLSDSSPGKTVGTLQAGLSGAETIMSTLIKE
jgi:hypothetical protein